MADHWRAWAWARLPPLSDPNAFVRTSAGFPALLYYASTLLAPAVVPTLSQAAGTVTYTAAQYLLRHSIERIASADWGSRAATTLVDRLLSMPLHAFTFRSRRAADFVAHHPPLPATRALSGYALSLALALSTVGTLFLEYLGMKDIAADLPAMRHLAEAQPNDPSLTAQCKRFLVKRYPQGYTPEMTLDMQTVDPVRAVYNVLVGFNHAFFYTMSGKPSDPAAEILHWSAIWFYWEVLAQLVRLYGLSPVTIAYRQVHAELLRTPK